MARKPGYKTLDQRIAAHPSNSDVILTELGQQGDNKLRIVIRSNSYKQNMFARIERFDGVQWQTLYAMAGESMKTKEGLYYKVRMPCADNNNPVPINIADFVDDYAMLRNRAEQILF